MRTAEFCRMALDFDIMQKQFDNYMAKYGKPPARILLMPEDFDWFHEQSLKFKDAACGFHMFNGVEVKRINFGPDDLLITK